MIYYFIVYTFAGIPFFLGLMIWNHIKFQKEDLCISDFIAALIVSCLPFAREVVLFRMFGFLIKDIVLIKARK